MGDFKHDKLLMYRGQNIETMEAEELRVAMRHLYEQYIDAQASASRIAETAMAIIKRKR